MKKGLLLVVALLAVASLMAAMAYTSANVNNDASLTVASSDGSLIALVPGEGVGNKDGAAFINGGELELDLAKGYNGTLFGVQGDSTYKWDNLFTVKNNSNETIEFNITKDGWGFDTKANIYLGATNTKSGSVKKEFYCRSNARNGKVTLAPNEEAVVYLYIETEKGAKMQVRDATLTVNATAK